MQVSLWLLRRQLCKYFSYSVSSSTFHPCFVLRFLALMLMDGAAIFPPLSLIVFTSITSLARNFLIAGIPKTKRKIEARTSWSERREVLTRTPGLSHWEAENFILWFSSWFCTFCLPAFPIAINEKWPSEGRWYAPMCVKLLVLLLGVTALASAARKSMYIGKTVQHYIYWHNGSRSQKSGCRQGSPRASSL